MEKEHELKQMRRNLDESEGAIAQVNLIVLSVLHYHSIHQSVQSSTPICSLRAGV